jgi:hypothetical protein
MRIVIGLLALALMGADGPAPSGPQQICYELRVVELASVDWRGDVYPKLQTVAHQGNSTVWTAPKEVVAQILKRAETEPKAHVVAAPKVIAASGSLAHIGVGHSRNIITDVTRVADGPVNHASTVAWVPKFENAREGMSATFRGRKIDQGVLTQFAFEETRVVSVHDVKLTEVQEPGQVQPGDKRWDKMAVRIEVPEVAHDEVTGEWLIPNDGVLLVSLGVCTVAEKDGKAGVRERLALVEARTIDSPPSAPVASRWSLPLPPSPVTVSGVDRAALVAVPAPVIPNTPTAIPMPVLPMAAPVVPSRTLPQPRDAQGGPVALPPLPDAHHAPPTTMPDSSEPCATPQSRGHHPVVEPVPEGRSSMPAVDLESTRADYEMAENRRDIKDAPAVDGKGVLFRIPVNGSVTIEIRAVAKTSGAPPPPPAPATATSIPKWTSPAKPH